MAVDSQEMEEGGGKQGITFSLILGLRPPRYFASFIF